MLKCLCFCNLSQLSLSLGPARVPMLTLPSPVSTLSSQLSEVFFDLIIIPKHSHRIICQGGRLLLEPHRAPRSWLGLLGRAFSTAKLEIMAVSLHCMLKKHGCVNLVEKNCLVETSTITGQSSLELISQTTQWDSHALLQTTILFPEKTAQCTVILHRTIPLHNATSSICVLLFPQR